MDPTILNPPTRFARPVPTNSRSPSHSPSRRQHFISHGLDPLLAELSPTSTLEALQNTDAVIAEAGTHKRALLDSVATASASDREWGIKAALAAKKVRQWYEELAAWPWPATQSGRNGFKPPRAKLVNGSHGIFFRDGKMENVGWQLEYCGSLQAQRVHDYEHRIENITDDMETLELEELKEHVRTSHRPNQGHPGRDDKGHAHMDDFTAIITTTIMQTLPQISRLNALLAIWSTRLMVLRQVPGYLECLEKAEVGMRSAWSVTQPATPESEAGKIGLDGQTFSTIREVLETQIFELGQRLDSMLDALEGREDSLPDSWIDKMEGLEADLGTWVVKAERQVLEHEYNIAAEGSRGRRTDSDDFKKSNTLAFAENGASPKPLGSPIQLDNKLPENPSSDDILVLDEYLTTPDLPPQLQNGEIDSSEVLGNPQPRKRYGNLPDLNKKKVPGGAPFSLDTANTQPHATDERASQLEGLLAPKSLPAPPLVHSSPPNGSIGEQSESFARGVFVSPQSGAALENLGGEVRGRTASRPLPLDLKRPRDSTVSNTASESLAVSFPGSSTSDCFSDASSPEIRQASRAEYFGAPVEVTTPCASQKDPLSPMEVVSRQSSQRTERGSRSMSADYASGVSPYRQRSRASSVVLNATIPEDGGLGDMWAGNRNGSPTPLRTRSASSQSIEVVPRKEVRDITIQRKGSPSNAPRTPPNQTSEAGQGRYFFYPPSQQTPSPFSWTKYGANSKYLSSSRPNIEPSENLDKSDNLPQPPPPNMQLVSNPKDETYPSATPSRSPNRPGVVADLPSGSTPGTIRQRRKSDTSPNKPNSRVSSPVKDDTEQLEARISSILSEIPGHIQLTSASEPRTPDIKPSSSLRRFLSRSKTTPRLHRATTTTTTPTLTSDQPHRTKSHPTSNSPEIKLYHLHQSDKSAAPIKLFVRLVGESGERVMVRIGGGWADLSEYLKEYASHHGKRSISDSRFAIQELPSSPITTSPESRPTSSHTHMTPEVPRPGSSDESPLGGAGVSRIGEGGLSPRKRAWVEGMLEQARMTGERGVGELGKVGGTRRVFLRAKTGV